MMKRTRIASVIAFTIIAGGGAGLSACKEKDDEKLILALLERGAILAEEHNTGKILKLTTETFTAAPGSRDREEVRGILTYAFMRYGNFKIKFPSPTIKVAPSKDMADVEVPFVILREGTLLPDLTGLYNDPGEWIKEVGKSTDPYHLELGLYKIGGEWKVQRANLQGLRSLESL